MPSAEKKSKGSSAAKAENDEELNEQELAVCAENVDIEEAE